MFISFLYYGNDSDYLQFIQERRRIKFVLIKILLLGKSKLLLTCSIPALPPHDNSHGIITKRTTTVVFLNFTKLDMIFVFLFIKL